MCNNPMDPYYVHNKIDGFFLLEVNNRETIAVIEVNNDTYCPQKRIEKFSLLMK